MHWLTLVPGCGFACCSSLYVVLSFGVRDELLGVFGGPATFANEFNGAETLYCGRRVHFEDVYVSDGHDSFDGGHASIVLGFLGLGALQGVVLVMGMPRRMACIMNFLGHTIR